MFLRMTVLSIFVGFLVFAFDSAKAEELKVDISTKADDQVISFHFQIQNKSQKSLLVHCQPFSYATTHIKIHKNRRLLRPFVINSIRPSLLSKEDLTLLRPQQSCQFEITGTLKWTRLVDFESRGQLVKGTFLIFENSAYLIPRDFSYSVTGEFFQHPAMFRANVQKNKRLWHGEVDTKTTEVLISKKQKKERIFRVERLADRKARELGYNLEDYYTIPDLSNSFWLANSTQTDRQVLDGKNFVTFLYVPKPERTVMEYKPSFFILIDRETREVVSYKEID